VNIQDNNGNNPLHDAVKFRNADIVNLLIDSDADIDVTIKNNKGDGAIDMVSRWDRETIGRRLVDAGAVPKETDIQCGLEGCFGYTRITNSNDTTRQSSVRLQPPSAPPLVGGRKTRRRRRQRRTNRRRRSIRRFSRF